MTGDALPLELELLLDTAKSEAKRRSHQDVTAGHLAAALLRDHAKIAARLGGDAEERLEARLRDVPRSFDEPAVTQETRALLQECRVGEPLVRLAERLSEWMGEAPPGPSVGTQPELPRPSDRTATRSPSAMTQRVENAGAQPTPPEPSRLVPDHLVRFVTEVPAHREIRGREAEVRRLLTLLRTRHRIAPLVVAAEGAGRTSLLGALAAAMEDLPENDPLAGRGVVRIVPESVIASGRGEVLQRVLAGLGPSVVIGVDDLEVLAGLGSSMAADFSSIGVLRSALARPDRSLVFLLAADYLDRLRAVDREFVDELTLVRLGQLAPEDVLQVARAHAGELSAHHRVALPEAVVLGACGPATEADRVVHPSLAILRLDRAAAAARAEGRDVRVSDLAGVAPAQHRFDPTTAVQRLGQVIVGQDHVLERVVNRLAITRAGLDQRPERPDGVFLFVGPTGVGKTAMAHSLAREVYGDDAAVLRLDMSEYAEQHTVSKLVGSPPGYVGSTDPEGWLTTRIRANGDVVLLLDEIEKAHPQVWNAFLQVFDAGRLTDGQGRTAHFRDTVIVMTSNIGSETFSAAPRAGFGEREVSVNAEEAAILRAVRERMAPELLNRLDDVLVFHPLDRGAIGAIARRQVNDLVERVRSRGYSLTVSDDVFGELVEQGFSREYGARPLQRAIERLLLSPLARLAPGAYTANLVDGSVAFAAAPEKPGD